MSAALALAALALAAHDPAMRASLTRARWPQPPSLRALPSGCTDAVIGGLGTVYAHTRRPYCTCTTCASARTARLRPHALSTPTPRTTRSLPNRRAPRAPRGCQPSDTMINMTGMDKHDLLTAFDEEQKHDDGCRTVHLLTALLLALAGIVRVVAGRPAATIASRAPKSAPDRGKDTPARAGIVRRRKGPVRGLRRGHVRTHTLKLHARIERANRQRDALRPTSTRHALATREHATAVAGWRVSNRKRRSAEREVRRDEKRVKDSVAIWNKCVYRARVYSTRKAVGPCGLPLPAPYLLHVRGGDETSPARDYAARDDYEAAQRRAGEAREAAAGSRRRLEVGRQVEAADRERALRAVAELVWARREARTAAVAAPHRALTLAHRRQWAMVERRRRRVKRREMPPPPLPAAAQHAEPTPQHQPPKPPPPSLPSAPPIELTSKLPPIWSPHLCADWPGERGVWRRRPWTTVWLLFLLGGFCLEGNPRGKAERETMQRALVINVCGLKAVERPGSIGAARTREAGESMLWDASTKLMDIVTMIKEGGVSIAVLADTHHTETMDEVVIRLLEEEFGLCAFATAGGMNAETVSRGVMIVWDPREVEFDGKDACKRPTASAVGSTASVGSRGRRGTSGRIPGSRIRG